MRCDDCGTMPIPNDCWCQQKEGPVMRRRKRSHMTETDCLEALANFSKRVDRMLTGSHGIDPHTFAPEGKVSVCFEVRGGFGVADDVFEAIRVLGGHKLPAKEGQ